MRFDILLRRKSTDLGQKSLALAWVMCHYQASQACYKQLKNKHLQSVVRVKLFPIFAKSFDSVRSRLAVGPEHKKS